MNKDDYEWIVKLLPFTIEEKEIFFVRYLKSVVNSLTIFLYSLFQLIILLAIVLLPITVIIYWTYKICNFGFWSIF